MHGFWGVCHVPSYLIGWCQYQSKTYKKLERNRAINFCYKRCNVMAWLNCLLKVYLWKKLVTVNFLNSVHKLWFFTCRRFKMWSLRYSVLLTKLRLEDTSYLSTRDKVFQLFCWRTLYHDKSLTSQPKQRADECLYARQSDSMLDRLLPKYSSDIQLNVDHFHSFTW